MRFAHRWPLSWHDATKCHLGVSLLTETLCRAFVCLLCSVVSNVFLLYCRAMWPRDVSVCRYFIGFVASRVLSHWLLVTLSLTHFEIAWPALIVQYFDYLR